jgi:serine/threonine protein kinase
LPLRGEKLDKASYANLCSTGGGAVGEAWVGDHEVLGCKVVQKRYSVIGMEDSAACREPRILLQMEHANVVRVLEAQWDPEMDRAITFVTVYCEGRCVAKALDEDYRFSVGQALRLAVQMLSALAYAHTDPSLRVVHRDVKPGNGFLDKDRTTLYLGDWGSAAEMDASGTAAGIEGTLLYPPPEGGPPGGRVGVPSDIYGAGMTLFEMLNGPLPYSDLDAEKLDRCVTRGLIALPPAAFVFEPHVPEHLRRVVRKAIRPKPDDRFPTASAFIAVIEQVRSIDWTHQSGRDLDGVWEGSWPLHVAATRRRWYRVESVVLQAGPSRAKRRLRAYQAVSQGASFARFGVADATVDADDRSAIERFFAAVEASAAQRIPARR